ncbi:MAG TPA: SDR family oxidoreductase [Nitrospira sp.]|nr:SDR family oxidoreductase [Nitrospira sp.]
MSYLEELFSLKGKNALVTGAASGLGQRFAYALAKAGARVALADKNSEGLKTTAKMIKDIDGESIPITVDLRKRQEIMAAFDKAIASFQRIHVLVNCAGIAYWRPMLELSEEDWDDTLDTNLKGSWLMAQRVAKHMIEHQIKGSIINVSSATSTGAQKDLTHYSTSKAGVDHLTRNMSYELAPYGIRVNTFGPGGFKTAMVEEFLKTPDGKKAQNCVPVKRFADLHEVDGPLLLLASDASSYMTGSRVAVDGGLCSHPHF